MTLSLRGVALALALGIAPLAPAAAEAHAQPAPGARGGWTTVRLAKWALLAAAVGFGTYALAQSNQADDAYGALRTFCRTDQDRCALSGGRYADPAAERLYDRALAADRRAQVGIIGGQVTLLGSAALFVYDLRNGRGPADIPYPGSAARAARRVVVGARLAF